MSEADLVDEPSSTRLVLYTRSGCHLCEPARDVVAEVAQQVGASWREVGIDVGPDADALTERFGEMVPVVTVDGVVQGYWRLDPVRLRRALDGVR
ncbi:MAG: glutaredoxin family protein [Cellulomonadaceae bacterium]|nr:glutaredoxin family protein [Cellulomonadaceae bacterium]